MPMTSRGALAAGLSLVGLVGLVAPTLGQQDRAVQKTASTAPPAAPTPKPVGPALVGSVDIEKVFKEYAKVKDSSEAFKAEYMAKQQDLARIASEGKRNAEMLGSLQQGTPDFKRTEEAITRLKTELQIKQEQAQNDLVQTEADSLALLYNDIQAMVAGVAKQRNLTYVVKVSNEKVESTEPNSVMAAMARTVVYADPGADITPDVIYWLNKRYQAATAAQPGAAAAPAANGAK